MRKVTDRMIVAAGVLLCLGSGASAQQTTSTAESKSFEVIAVTGNELVVRLPEGTRAITVPSDFRFNVEGQQLTVQQLKPGMKGTATITTKTTVTPVTVTEVKNGTVMQAGGPSIIVRTDEGIRMFTQGDIDKRGVKIMRSGKAAEISDLRTGDKLTATIVTSKPPRVVTEKEVNATLASAAAKPAAAASAASTADPAPTATAGSAGAAPAPARRLPKTASPLPLVGFTGLAALLTAAALTARRRLRR